MVRSHAAWMEKGEKCTAHFLRLNQRNSVKKNIMSLYRNDVLVTNPQEILQEECEYFKTLYSNDAILESLNGVTEQNFPLNNVSVLSTSQQLSCEGEITEQELLEAINSFSSGKSPGIDGIPIEMYKIFFTEIKKPLLESFNFSFQQGILSNSQREGVISVLLKQNPDGKYKDPKWLKNWRPLTLLCCDTRILSKCIALRIKNIIGDVINNNQAGFIKGRFIGDNLRQILDTIHFYENHQEPGLLFIADFEKAFDKIQWKFIKQCLSFFNFGKNLIQWFETLYNHPVSRVINNGHISDTFLLTQGVRQGCPLSPYLFILCIEILAIKIRNNPDISGLFPNGKEIKLTMYADDAIFFIKPTQSTLEGLIRELNTFSKISGLKPNFAKCNILRIGTLKDTNFILNSSVPVKWINGDVNLLGIHLPDNFKEIVKFNYERGMEKADRILQPWRGNSLTIQGKVTLINTLVIPQFTHLLMLLPSPSMKFFKHFEQKMFKFIWNNKQDKIKRQYLYNSYDNGGLNLKNLRMMDCSLKASWVAKIYHNKQWITSQRLYSAFSFFSNNIFPF